MPSPDICACVTSADDLDMAHAVRDHVALYEVRMDLIGEDWVRVVGELPLPWIACNRIASEGGRCRVTEVERLDSLMRAIELGAAFVDIEMASPNVQSFVNTVKDKTRVVVSHHDFEQTESDDRLIGIVERERALGADVCKLVTTARTVQDSVRMVQLARRFRSEHIVAFAMGPLGMVSRVLAPLAGAMFTYASLSSGREAAPGQLTVGTLRALYHSIGGA